MGLFDGKVSNSFDRMFDWNRDGKMDRKERAMQFSYLESLCEDNSEEKEEDSDYFYLDDEDSDFDE